MPAYLSFVMTATGTDVVIRSDLVFNLHQDLQRGRRGICWGRNPPA